MRFPFFFSWYPPTGRYPPFEVIKQNFDPPPPPPQPQVAGFHEKNGNRVFRSSRCDLKKSHRKIVFFRKVTTFYKRGIFWQLSEIGLHSLAGGFILPVLVFFYSKHDHCLCDTRNNTLHNVTRKLKWQSEGYLALSPGLQYLLTSALTTLIISRTGIAFLFVRQVKITSLTNKSSHSRLSYIICSRRIASIQSSP